MNLYIRAATISKIILFYSKNQKIKIPTLKVITLSETKKLFEQPTTNTEIENKIVEILFFHLCYGRYYLY